jgi:hypothetical protein
MTAAVSIAVMLSDVYHHSRKTLCATAAQIVSCRDAEDFLHDAFVRALESRATFRVTQARQPRNVLHHGSKCTMPCRIPMDNAWVRSRAFNLARIALTCSLTVW